MFVEYTTKQGLKQLREVREGARPDEYEFGLVIGPPDLSELGLRSADTKKLNNVLFAARFLELRDLKGQRSRLAEVIRECLGIADRGSAKELMLRIISIYQRRAFPEAFGEGADEEVG